jgi:predicted PurR-regulated permease PerM
MSFPDRRTANVLFTILLFATVLAVIYIARVVLIIFCFSILFAYLIDPVVRFLQRHSLFFKNLRGPHVAEAYLALLLVIGLLVHALAPGSLGRIGRGLQEIPSLSAKLSTGEIATEMGNKYGWDDTRTLRLKAFLVGHRSDIQVLMGSAKRSATTAIGAIVVIPILAIFFLSDGKNLADQAMHLVSSPRNFDAMQSLVAELHVALQHYIRGKVILGALSFTYASVGLLLLRFPHPLALGILAGMLEFIPIAGWMLAATTIIVVGLFTHSHWIWMALLLAIWRMLMDYWIAPQVFGRELEMHPLLAIFTLMVGGAVGGLPGAYLSLPIAAVIRVVWKHLGRPRDFTDRSQLDVAFDPGKSERGS